MGILDIFRRRPNIRKLEKPQNVTALKQALWDHDLDWEVRRDAAIALVRILGDDGSSDYDFGKAV